MSKSRPPPLPVLPASTPPSSASPSPQPSHYSSPSLPQTQRFALPSASLPSPPAAAAAAHHHMQSASHPPLHSSSPHTPQQQQQQQQPSSSPYHTRLASTSSAPGSSPASSSSSVNHSSAERSTPGYHSQRNSLLYTEGDSLDHSYAFVISAPASNPTSTSPSPSHTPPVHGQQQYGQHAAGVGELSAALTAASLSSTQPPQQQQQQQQQHAYPVLSQPPPPPSSSSMYPSISPPTRTAPPPVPSHMMRVNPSPPLRPDSPLVPVPPVSLQSLSGPSSSPVEARRSDSLSKDDDDAKTVEFYLKQAIQAQDATAVTSLLEKARRLQVDSGLVSAALSVLGESMKTLSFYLRQSMDTKSKDGLKMALDKLTPLMEQVDKAGLRSSHAELFALVDDGRRLLAALDKEAAQTVHFYLKQGIQLRSRDVIKQSLDKTPSIPAEYLDKDLITASQTLLAELDAQHLIKFYLQMAIKQKDDMALEKALDSAKKLRMGGDIAEVSEGSKLLVELRTRGKGGSARKGWKGSSSSSSSSSGGGSGTKANGSKKKSDRFVLFGGPLIDAVRQSDRPIPRICYQCMDFLRQHGLHEPGLFRVAGNRDAIELIRQQYEEGGVEVRLSEVHDVAGVLKLYLRMLPEPLIPYDKYDAFIRVGAKDKTRNAAKNAELREQVSQLPTENYALLCSLVRFLVDVARHSEVNKMTAENLAIVFAPNLIRPAQETANTMLYDMPIAINLIASFILCTDDIFTLPPTSPTLDHHAAANNSSAASGGSSFMPQYPSAVPSSSSLSASAVQPPTSSSPAFSQSLSSTLPHPVVTAGKKGPQSNTL